MADLLKNFEVFRGDLLYGQARDRGSVLKYLYAKHDIGWFIEEAMQSGAWVTVDNLNGPLDSGSVDYGADAEKAFEQMKAAVEKIKKKVEALKGNSSDPNRVSTTDDYTTLLDAYLDFIAEKGNRFSPLKVLEAPPDKLKREGWSDVKENRYYLAIRRACKFGIQCVVENMGEAKIHFVLNRFDRDNGWRDLIAKEEVQTSRRTGKTLIITYSELRYVYKNWAKFGPRVTFYRYNGPEDMPTDCPECPAPWDDTSRNVQAPDPSTGQVKTMTLKQLWEDCYSPMKYRYYKGLIGKIQAENKLPGFVHEEMKNYIEMADMLFEGNLVGQAITDLKCGLRALRKYVQTHGTRKVT